LLELASVLIQRQVSHSVTQAELRTNRHFLWMIPVSELVLFALLGLALKPFVRLRPQWFSRPAAFALTLFAFLAPMLSIRGLHPAASVTLAVGCAMFLLTTLEERAQAFRRFDRFGIPALAGVLLLLVVTDYGLAALAEGRTLAAVPPAASGAPNVLLIVLDTVRADHLSAYGYERYTTPNLKGLAARGVRFDRASSTAPWTLPSHASMFTGRWPSQLGVSVNRKLDATYPTLAEFLTSCGYATAGFVANTFFCNERFGLGRGFARYVDFPENARVSLREVLRSSEVCGRLERLIFGSAVIDSEAPETRRAAAAINREALGWLSQRPPDRPYFLFLNYMDAHGPYFQPPGYPRRYGNGGEIAAAFSFLVGLGTADKRALPKEGSARLRSAAASLRDAYDDCLVALDDQVGRLLRELETRGELSNTLIVVTSDHGDHFGEHSLFSHGCSLYGPLLHVPLIIVPPQSAQPGTSVAEPVSLRDLPATVADLIGRGAESPFLGRSLRSLWRAGPGESRPVPSPALSEVDLCAIDATERDWPPVFRGPMTSLESGRYRFILNGDGREELYELVNDPAEEHNVADIAVYRPRLEQFRRTIAGLRLEQPFRSR
jgi:arylsulfatase A-like enzyme